jgi:hypothetical protein
MAKAIVIKDGVVLLQRRKIGEIIENISPNDIYRFREFVSQVVVDDENSKTVGAGLASALTTAVTADYYPLFAGDSRNRKGVINHAPTIGHGETVETVSAENISPQQKNRKQKKSSD